MFVVSEYHSIAMEAQQQYHYQYQPQNDALASQPYDPSQIQSYDQSTQAYYAYHHPSNQYNQPHQPDYSSYYYQDYANSYQTDPNSIHPPGVPISDQTHVQNPQNLYYPHGVVASQPPPPQGFLQAGGSQAGRSGRGRGTFGRRGRGRGGGRGKAQITKSAAPSAAGGTQSVASSSEIQAAPTKPQPRMAWCELCRVDCTTLEVLEQHKNGKRHKRNLKVHEELQNLSKQMTIQTPNMPPPQVADGLQTYHPPNDNVALEPAATDSKAEATSEKNTADKSETSGALPSQESVRKDHVGGRGGLKRRSMRGGRGGKWMRGFDGSRRPVEPVKPKPVVPLICELCNVKCESQVVFESHVAGKKHLANVKRFQSHKETFGEGIQALYPTICNLPSTSIIPQADHLGPPAPTDAQALASMMLSQQNLQDPQAAQAALAQLLHQHGIHDAQTLITQLVPYLLAQFQQVPGTLPAPAIGLGIPTLNPLGQGVPTTSMGAESQSASVENKTEQQNVTGNAEPPQAIQGTNANPAA
ncbi:Zinc finger matrin-type protein 3 [Bienertia sinuspersici]